MSDEDLLAAARDAAGAPPEMPQSKPSSDPLLDAAREVVGGQASLLRNNLISAQGINPAEASKQQQLAASTGMPVETVRAQPEAAQTKAALANFDADALVQKYPHLAQFMSHPDNAAQVHPFVPEMATTEEAVKAMPTAIPAAKPVDASLLSKAGELPEATAKEFAGSWNKAASSLNTALGIFPTAYDKLASIFGSQDTHAAANWWQQNMVAPLLSRQRQFETPAEANLAVKAAGTVGSLLGMMNQIVLTGGEATAIPATAGAVETTKVVAANAGRAMAFPALTSAIDTGRKVYEATGDAAQATAATIEDWFANTAMGAVPLAAPGGVVKRMATGAVSGAAMGETARQAANVVMPEGMQQPFDIENTLLSGLSGAMLGGVLGPRGDLSHSAAVRKAYQDAVSAQQTEGDLQKLHYLGAVSEANPLRKNNPEAFKQFVQTMADDRNLTDVYVNAKDLDAALKQNVVEGQDFLHKSPETAAQIEEKAALGGDVRIPLADYATYIAGKPLDEALLPHLKTSPEGMTYAEGQKYFQGAAEEMKAQAENIVAKQAATDQEKADHQEVYNNVLEQLTNANHFPADVNKTYATLAAAGYVARAKEAGMSAKELWNQYPLHIKGGPTTETALSQRLPESPAEVQAAKQQAKAAVQNELKAGHITAEHAFRGTTVDELRAIAKTGRLVIGKDAEGNAGISAALIHDGQFPVYGKGVGYLIPPEHTEKQGYAAEVSVEPKADPRAMQYVIDGKVMPFDEMKKAVEAPQNFDLERDATKQAAILSRLAHVKGFDNVDEWVKQRPEEFAAVAAKWRAQHPVFAQEKQPEPYTGPERRVDLKTREAVGKELAQQKATEEMAKGDAWYQAKFAPTFFSQLSKSIEATPERIFQTGKQVSDWLDSNSAKLGIKKAEIEATGITDWLKLQGKVSKADVMAYLDGNGVQVKDVMLGKQAAEDALKADFQAEGYDIQWDNEGMNYIDPDGDMVDYDELPETLQKKVDTASKSYDDTKFASYQLPGGENYRELLLTLPFTKPKIFEVRRKGSGFGVWNTETNDWATTTINQDVAESGAERLNNQNAKNVFRSGHFDHPNILAHIRFNERTDAEGKRVLFLEEIQSDWGQKGKKEGFAQQVHEYKIQANPSRGTWDVLDHNGNRLDSYATKDQAQHVVDASKKQTTGVPSAPFVTDTKSWTALALKRMIRYAAENGFDRVAWTTGEQQAARYDLSKQVDKISVWGDEKDGYYFDATKDGRGAIADKGKPLSASELADTIGKDLAKKAVDDIKNNRLATYEGQDLKVGGEGMKGYYDQIVPQVANDILKKMGGGKVEGVPLRLVKTVKERTGQSYIAGKENTKQQGFTITPEMRAKVLQEGQPLFQEARAAYIPNTSTMHLLKDADLSSFTHELGHHFLELTDHLADRSIEMRADMDTVLNWFGKTSDEWRKMSLEEKRPFHEKFAEGFERYLLEGHAPSVELRPIFARVRNWMVQVYRDLTGLLAARPQAEQLTPEVRQVFDRLLATEDAIKQAEAVKNYEPLFKSAKEAGMGEQAYKDYISLGERATSQAISDMERKAMRDMQWLSGAKGKMLKAMQRDAASKRREIRDEVTKEVEAQPIEQAHKHFTEGEVKLSKDDLKAMNFSDADIAKLKGMTSADGIHPDMAADALGIQSGDVLVRGLLDREDPTHAIDGLTDQRMLERYGELSDPQAIERAANQAIANDARARFMATGLKVLTKSPISASALAKAAKAVAEEAIGKKKVKELHPAQYDIQEAKANRAALKAAPKDAAAAIQAQREALLNNRMSRASNDAIDDVRKGLDYLKRFSKDSVRQKIDLDIRDQIDDLLGRFDLRQNVTTGPTRAQLSLKEWVASQEAAGYTPMVAPDMADPAIKMHYKEMTVDQFRGLHDTVKALEHIGKERKYATISGERTNIDEYVREKLVPKILSRGVKFTPEQLMEKPEDRYTNPIAIAFDHFNSWRRMAAAELLPQSHKANFYDRHEILGPFNEAITSRVLEANYNKVRMLKGLSDDFQKQADALGRDWQKSLRDSVKNDKLVDPDTGKLMSFTRGRMIGLAIHVGNESNFHKLTAGYNFKGEDVWAFLHDNMSEKDWQATQAVWDLYEKHWPEVDAMNRRLGNTSPQKIEARPFKTNFGEQRGGYAAISYDSLRSRRGERQAAGEAINPSEGLFGRGYFRADTTTNGSLNARQENYVDRVDLDFHSIPRHLQETIHDLAYREALIDTNKIIEHPEFRKAFRSVYGREAYRSIQDWLGGLANSNTLDNQIGALGKFLQYTRTGMVMNAIAFRASTVIKHGGSAAFKSMGYFAGGGEKYFARRMAAMGTNYTAEIEGARQKFGEIFARLLQQDRDFKQTSTSMFEPESVQAKGERFGHAMVAWSDMMTAVPTAWAAYDRAIAEGIPKSQGGTGKPMTEAQAVDYANRIVREAHGSYTEAGRSMVLNNKSEAMKMFTTLYSFMNNAYGQQLDSFDKLRTSGINSAPVLARVFMAILVPGLVAGYVKENLPHDDESWAHWSAKAIADEVAASVPFVRDAVGMVEGFRGAGMVAASNWLATLVVAGKDLATGTGKPIRDFANAVGMGLHIPGLGQLGSSAQYVADVQSGKKTPQSQAELVKGVVVGH